MIACAFSLILCLTAAETPDATAERLTLAAGVALWAERNADADAMTLAAEMVARHATGDLSDPTDADDRDAQSLFDQAAALAADAPTRSRVDQRRSVAPRGVGRALGAAGPIARLMLIAPERPLTFSLTARGSEQALLHVGPTAGGVVEVEVADARGAAVCAQRAAGRPVLCSWRPTFTTTYRVRIRALSAAPVTTVITSN